MGSWLAHARGGGRRGMTSQWGRGFKVGDKKVLELKVVTVNILNANELYISNNNFF